MVINMSEDNKSAVKAYFDGHRFSFVVNNPDEIMVDKINSFVLSIVGCSTKDNYIITDDNMVIVKSHYNNGRFTFIVEHPNGFVADKINSFLRDVAGNPVITDSIPGIKPKSIDSEPVSDLSSSNEMGYYQMVSNPIPLPMSVDEALSTIIEGTNVTLKEAIEHYDTSSVVIAYINARRCGESTIASECRKYLINDCELRLSIDSASTLEVKTFCALYDPLLKDSIREVLDQAGYESLDMFFRYSDEYLHQNAYLSWLLNLIEEL